MTRATDLHPGSIYTSPSGRLCRFVPSARVDATTFAFRYLGEKDESGFVLSYGNLRHLREYATPTDRMRA